jgi:hypothetical protein
MAPTRLAAQPIARVGDLLEQMRLSRAGVAKKNQVGTFGKVGKASR